MPIHELRESIEQAEVQLDSSGYAIIQKKINLLPGQRHTMVQCDIFQDAIVTSNGAQPFFVEFFVTPMPVVYSVTWLVTGVTSIIAANSKISISAIPPFAWREFR